MTSPSPPRQVGSESPAEQENMGVFASVRMLDEYSGFCDSSAATMRPLFPIEERVVHRHFPPPPAHALESERGAGLWSIAWKDEWPHYIARRPPARTEEIRA